MTDKRPGLLPTERIAYSPIAGRKKLKLPGGARMVVWCIVNVEEWDILSAMPRTVLTPPAGGAPSPDIPNWAWHEYGNRVGFWRMLKVFDDFKVPATLAINGSAIAAYPQIFVGSTITVSLVVLSVISIITPFVLARMKSMQGARAESD